VVVPRFDDDGTFLGFLGSCTDITEVRTSHEELRASEERYRNVVESQRELICRYLADGTLTFVNDAYCNYFQRSREDLLGKPFYSLLPEDEQKRTQELVDSLVRDPRHEPIQHKVLLADGGIGWQEWVDHTITDSEGRFVEMQGIGRDITEQKRAAAALLESEQRFQSFMDNSPAAACIMDANARILYVNDTYRRLIKVPDGSIVGKTAFDLFDPKTASNLYRAVVSVAETGKPIFGFEESPRPDGSLGSFLVCKFPLEMGGQRCVGGFAVDVTDQKNAEQRTKESEELFRTLLADLHTGVLLLDPESEVLLANQAALDLLGMTSEQLIGKRAFDADWKAVRENGAVLPQIEHPVLKAVKTQVPVRGAIVSTAGRSGNGSAWLQIDSIPNLDEAGNLKHVIATFSDITDLKTAMEALKISRNEYRRIVETAYEGVWMVDAAGRTVFTNERFAEMLGYTAEEIKDKSVLELIGSDARLGKIQESERQKDRPKSQFDAKLQHNNGSDVWGLVSAAPLYSDDGDFVGSLLMVTDITSRKTAEDQVQKMATRILNLQDEERRRIARALHDETAQDLAVLNMHISSLKRRIFQDDAGAREDLEKCQMLINNSLREVRTLSYLLHPRCSTMPVSFGQLDGTSRAFQTGAISTSL
jgi:PAS domain S-box-containing protein